MASNDKPPPSQPNPAPPVSVPLQRTGALPSYYPAQAASNTVAGPSILPSHYAPNSTWKNGWTMAAYPYTSSQTITPYPQQQYLYAHPKAPLATAAGTSVGTSALNFAPTIEATKTKHPSPVPSPSEPCKDWDYVLKTFMESIGLTQALRGFERDMLVMNSNWEKQKVPCALQELVNNIQKIQQGLLEERSLDERKLDHVHLADGYETKTPTALIKSVSTFLAQKRANNEASNRAEFLRSLSQRSQDEASSDALITESPSSCARTDAKAVDRNAQIKYDIAKNEDGPLRRTMRSHGPSGSTGAAALHSTSTSTSKGKAKAVTPKNEKVEAKIVNDLSSDRHPGLDERLTNLENHLAVRYVPHAPQSLLDRLHFLEEHIIKLEKDYPPWAAIQFNQQSRNWPPPPKQTPIIVPPSMSRQQPRSDGSSQSVPVTSAATASLTKGRNSSLHRAVMERLEVHNAKLDLTGGR